MTVTVSPSARVDVRFDVECKTTGIEITTRTTGPDNPSVYAVLLSGEPWPADPNGSLVVGRLQSGPNTVTLTRLGDNCPVVGANPITVDVVNLAVTPVAFDVICIPLARPEMIAYERSTSLSPGSRIHLVNTDGSGDVELALGSAPSWSTRWDQARILDGDL